MRNRHWLPVAIVLAVVAGIPLTEEPALDTARGIGYTVCHQLPTHSFFAGGEQYPLCARCTGIYLGFLVGLAGMALLGKLRASIWPPAAVSTILMFSMALMVGDGFNSLTSSLPGGIQAYQPTNFLRLVTGIAAGTSLALLLVPLLNDTLWAERDLSHSVADFGELVGFAILAALVSAVVYSEAPFVLPLVSLLSTLGVLATIGTAGTALAATLLRREKRCYTFAHALPLFAVGIGLSLVMMAGLGALRYFYALPVGV